MSDTVSHPLCTPRLRPHSLAMAVIGGDGVGGEPDRMPVIV